MIEKKCTKCGETFPATTEYFPRKKRNKIWCLESQCKKCRREYKKKYRESNKERIREKKKQDYNKNREQILEQRKQHYSENKEKIIIYQKKYYTENREQILEKQKEYRINHKEEISERNKQYRQKNPERRKKYYKNNKEQENKRSKEYRENNKERISKRMKKYYKNNKEKISKRSKEYRENNKERISERHKEYSKNLPAGIYKIINTKADQIYVGQSSSYPKRWNHHKSTLRNNKHQNQQLQEDYNTYGEEAFVFEVIEELPCDTSPDVLLKKESEQIKKHLREGKSIYNCLN